MILKSLNSVNQQATKQREFCELSYQPYILLCSNIRILCYVSISHWSIRWPVTVIPRVFLNCTCERETPHSHVNSVYVRTWSFFLTRVLTVTGHRTGQTPSWILYSSVVPTLLQRQRTDWKSSIHKRRFTRMIPDLKDIPYEQRLADLIEVYKLVHGLSAVRFNTFFEFSHTERTSGHFLKLHKNVLWRISDRISFRTG